MSAGNVHPGIGTSRSGIGYSEARGRSEKESPVPRLFVPLPYSDVILEDGFWGHRQIANSKTSLREGYLRLEGEGHIDNFRDAAAGSVSTPRRGLPVFDSDVYKWLEAVGWEIGRVGGDSSSELSTLAQELISLVAATQGEDGYVGSWFRAPGDHFSDLLFGLELYCAGHLFQSGVAWQQGAGDGRLLGVATRFADCITSVFGAHGLTAVPEHPGIEMGLVELYRVTGDERYLAQAKLFLERRGHGVMDWEQFGERYRQDDVPFRQSGEARGHAVMAAYLACGALDVYMETGDAQLLDAAVAQWEDMVARRMYVTGGVGSRHKDESFGDPFELPPDRAYAETCAAIGVVMWSWRLLLITGEACYADMVERALFNAFAAGVSLDGSSYFYVNPLQVRAGHVDPDDGRGRAARSPWYEIACCPPNVMRTLSALGRYFATASADGVQVWQFAPGRISATVGGDPVELAVETTYPLDGRVTVRVVRTASRPWEIGLRVPAWASTAAGSVVAGSPGRAGAGPEPGSLWRVARPWQEGDQVVLELPMASRVTYPHPRIDAVPRMCGI